MYGMKILIVITHKSTWLSVSYVAPQVEYATIASVKKQEEMKSEEQGTEGGDKSQTATTLV